MFFRSKKLQEWANLNNLQYTKNNKKDLLEYWADRNIIEGNYKGKNIKIFDAVVDATGGGEGGIIFGTVIIVNGIKIIPKGAIKSFKFWGKLLSVKTISKLLDENN